MDRGVKKMENQNKGLKNLVIVLSVLVLGLGGFIIYDKVLSNNDDIKTEEKETEKN